MSNHDKKEQPPKPVGTIQGLSKKLDFTTKRLDTLENLVFEKPKYEGFAASLRLTEVELGVYDEPLKTAARLKRQIA
jgi:hypothetical protein